MPFDKEIFEIAMLKFLSKFGTIVQSNNNDVKIFQYALPDDSGSICLLHNKTNRKVVLKESMEAINNEDDNPEIINNSTVEFLPRSRNVNLINT